MNLNVAVFLGSKLGSDLKNIEIVNGFLISHLNVFQLEERLVIFYWR